MLPVPGFRALLPSGALTRGSVITIGGSAGAGASSAALACAAAATTAGEWAAIVDPGPAGAFGGLAARDAGVVLERCAVVREVGVDRWATVVAALLDGITVVVAPVPLRIGLGDARRLQARARANRAVLVALESVPGLRCGVWPGEALRRIVIDGAQWHGLDADGGGLLAERVLHARGEGKGMPCSARIVA